MWENYESYDINDPADFQLCFNNNAVSICFHGKRLTNEELAPFATWLSTNTLVRDLDLISCRIGVKGALLLSHMLICNKSIKNLNISGNEFGAGAVSLLAMCLTFNSSLESLDISCCDITDFSLISKSGILATNTSLRKLVIAGNEIEVEQLEFDLKENTSLRYLDISEMEVNYQGMDWLNRVLAVNTTLEVLMMRQLECHTICQAFHIMSLKALDLTHCFSQRDFRGRYFEICYLAENIKSQQTLIYLGLRNNGINTHGISYFVLGLRENTVLQSVDLDDNDIDIHDMVVQDLFMRVAETNTSLVWLGYQIDESEQIRLWLEGNYKAYENEFWSVKMRYEFSEEMLQRFVTTCICNSFHSPSLPYHILLYIFSFIQPRKGVIPSRINFFPF